MPFAGEGNFPIYPFVPTERRCLDSDPEPEDPLPEAERDDVHRKVVRLLADKGHVSPSRKLIRIVETLYRQKYDVFTTFKTKKA